MTLQTDLQAAVSKATAAAQKLHDVVHGDAASTVETDNGSLKTLARTIADNEAEIAASRVELDQKVAEAAAAAAAAEADADRAEQAASAIALPLPVTSGGTGADTPGGARASLGLGALAVKDTVSTADLDDGAVGYAKLQAVAAGRLLGRSAATAGSAEEIAVGAGLLLASGVLSTGAIKIALVRDEKPDGTDGGSSVSGAWNVRNLNTEAFDPNGIVTLAADRFTLQAGKYLILALVPFHDPANGNGFRARLQNITDGTTEAISSSAGDKMIDGIVVLFGYVDLAAAKQFEVQYRVNANRGTNGLGNDDGLSLGAEIYTQVLILQLG